MIVKILIVFTIGVFVGFYMGLYIIRRRKKQKKKVNTDTYAKFLTMCVIIHGMVLTSLSYVLAMMGLDPVVDVSSTIVREIVAPIIVYLTTNTVMNIFEKNKLSFSTPLNFACDNEQTEIKG